MRTRNLTLARDAFTGEIIMKQLKGVWVCWSSPRQGLVSGDGAGNWTGAGAGDEAAGGAAWARAAGAADGAAGAAVAVALSGRASFQSTDVGGGATGETLLLACGGGEGWAGCTVSRVSRLFCMRQRRTAVD